MTLLLCPNFSVSAQEEEEEDGVEVALKKFLFDSIRFYSALPGMVESDLSFTVPLLLSNQLEFSGKTHHRKVGWWLVGE